MLTDKLKGWLIANRVWEVYLLLQKLPEQEIELLSHLDELIERAVFTGTLRLQVFWPSLNKKLSIREKYESLQNKLRLESYSYVLIEIGDRVIIRADSAPHHERDYRGKLLSQFPHHLHDEKGQICSFSGKLEDFVKLVTPYIH